MKHVASIGKGATAEIEAIGGRVHVTIFGFLMPIRRELSHADARRLEDAIGFAANDAQRQTCELPR